MRQRVVSTIRALPGGESLLDQYRTLRVKMQRDPKLAHRGYVGGSWEEIGKVQFDFMLNQGLKPEDILLDVACGSLRAGRHFIAYLNKGHYLGLDHNRWLIEAGLKHEVPKAMQKEKRPEFVISDAFEFEKLTKQPTFALAQSLFSHLTKADIELCLRNLFAAMPSGGRFFATFVPMSFLPEDYQNPDQSADDKAFRYDAEEILEIGRAAGWQGRYIGDWGHPRGQEMLAFEKP
jgi:hypothetical protein